MAVQGPGPISSLTFAGGRVPAPPSVSPTGGPARKALVSPKEVDLGSVTTPSTPGVPENPATVAPVTHTWGHQVRGPRTPW
jgi:hypothetical protein